MPEYLRNASGEREKLFHLTDAISFINCNLQSRLTGTCFSIEISNKSRQNFDLIRLLVSRYLKCQDTKLLVNCSHYCLSIFARDTTFNLHKSSLRGSIENPCNMISMSITKRQSKFVQHFEERTRSL